MIWNYTNEPPADPLVKHIQAELTDAGITHTGAVGETARHAAAEAVAAFLRHEGRTTVASEYLLMLTARALWAVGDEYAARRLVDSVGRTLDFSRHYADAACTAGVTLDEWAFFFTSRAVRPAKFPSLGGDTLWVLDMAKLVSSPAPGLEMGVLRAIQAALARLADIWEDTDGNGLLGLSRLHQASGLILAAPPTARKSRRLAKELTKYCWSCLEVLRMRHGWTRQPGLVCLDLY